MSPRNSRSLVEVSSSSTRVEGQKTIYQKPPCPLKRQKRPAGARGPGPPPVSGSGSEIRSVLKLGRRSGNRRGKAGLQSETSHRSTNGWDTCQPSMTTRRQDGVLAR